MTILEREVWEHCLADLGKSIDPSKRRANLLLSGIRLAHTRGRRLHIGGATLEIGGELTPCERMDEALQGLQAALRPNWGGGVFAAVIAGGEIRIGDAVLWDSAPTSPEG